MLESESTSNSSMQSTVDINNIENNLVNKNNGSNSTNNSLFSTSNNEFLLCDSFPKNQNYSYLKISIKSSNSASIRVRSIRLLGVKRNTNKQQTAKDASACWFFEMLSSMTLLQSQLMPSMYNNLINISK